MDNKHSNTLYFLFCFFACIFGVFSQAVCKTTSSPCKCDTTDGLIDLSPLDKSDGTPKFQEESYDDTGTYSYNPCTTYSLDGPSPNGCVDMLGCQQLDNSQEAFALGSDANAKWTTDYGGNYMITLTAQDPIDLQTRTMQVSLICDPSADTATFSPSGDSGTLIYPMSLTTKYACPSKTPPKTTKTPTSTTPRPSGSGGGLSVGSVLCIIFIVLVTVYLIGGCLYNFFRKGARGQEVIPHVELWKEMPFYVKDGVMFVVYTVKGKRGEYQNI